jgi:D-3-phosphoglycerate dehydrogenase
MAPLSKSPVRSIAILATSFCKSDALVEETRRCFAGHKMWFNVPPKELSGATLIRVLKDCEIAIVGREKFDFTVISSLPKLRAIAKYGVGLDNLDLPALKRANIELLLEPGVNRFAVAELTVGLMITLLRKIASSDRAMRKGVWQKDGGRQLFGSTVAIVGCGAIGSEVARLLKAFSCKILLHDILDVSSLAKEVNGLIVNYNGALTSADVVTYHVPLTQDTERMLGFQQINSLKPGSIIINTSRGEIVDENAVIDGLSNGVIGGLGLDVFQNEPAVNPKLLQFDNFLGTAHIAGNSREAVLAMGQAAIRATEKFLLNI